MNILEELRSKNPGLELYSVEDDEFKQYGRVLRWTDTEELSEVLATTCIPEDGNEYCRSVHELETTEIVKNIRSCVFGSMEIEAGTCNGHGFTLNALEYHKCSEVNFSTTGLVLLLALQENIKDGKIDSSDVKGFFLPKNVLIEVYPMVMHFAPCRISDDGFRCLVVLENGTNVMLEQTDVSAPGEQAMLWMTNKWMICHPESPQAEKGAYVGITGSNIKLKI